MKTVTNTLLACLFSSSLLIPANANTLSELTTEVLTKQLNELHESIKNQTKQTIENTTRQIVEQFSFTVTSPVQPISNLSIDTAQIETEQKPQAEEE